MTVIKAKIIADSISPDDVRITTFQLEYPRWIHAEFMTHRVFSRNASSSRAIPVKKSINNILKNPAVPLYWGSNQKGMQAGEPISDTKVTIAKIIWYLSMFTSVFFAYLLYYLGLHKQLINRIIEPYSHISVIVTATDWQNFFGLRCHKDAEPHIRLLARKIKTIYDTETPRRVRYGEWHLPYITNEDIKIAQELNDFSSLEFWDFLIKISVARCARVSYLTHDKRIPTIEQDVKLHDRLIGARPLHATPSEHQATPDKLTGITEEQWTQPELHGNLYGWIQYRKTIPNEYIEG